MQSERRYLSWVSKDGPTGKERLKYGLYAGYADAVGACKEYEELAAYGARFLPLLEKVNRYYDEEDYRDDKFGYGKSVHPELLTGFSQARGYFSSVIVDVAKAVEPDPNTETVGESQRGLRLAVTALHPVLVGNPKDDTELKDIILKSHRALQDGIDVSVAVKANAPLVDKYLGERLERYRRRLKTKLRRIQDGRDAPRWVEFQTEVLDVFKDLADIEHNNAFR